MTGMSMYQDMKSNPASPAPPPIAAPPKSMLVQLEVEDLELVGGYC